MTTRKIIAFIITIILLLASNIQARADVAPPEPPSGTDPEPGNETTNVRMMAETVLIKINANSPLDTGDGKVTATFIMRNLGNVDEQMEVRFPLDQTIKRGELCAAPVFQYPTINNIKVKVNGKAVFTRTTYQTVPLNTEKDPPPTTTIPCWANFPVSFRVGKDVIIEVTYNALPYDELSSYNYSYVLVTDDGQDREDRFDKHAFIPSSFLADFHVLWHAILVSKAEICQGNGLSKEGFNDWMKMLVVHIHGCPIPIDDSANIIQQHTNLDPDAPPTFVATLFSHLLLAASFPDRKQQLNGITVDHGKERWGWQKQITPILMGLPGTGRQGRCEQPLQSSSFGSGSIAKLVTIILLEPAVERSEVTTFEGKQDAARH